MGYNNQSTGQEFTEASSGGSPIGGMGTINTVAKFTAATTIGNSNITDNGTTVGIAGTNLSFTGSGTSTFSGTTFTFNGSGAAAFGGSSFVYTGSGAAAFSGTTFGFTGSGAASFGGTTFGFTGSGGATFSGTTFTFNGSGASVFSGTSFLFNGSQGFAVNGTNFTFNGSNTFTVGGTITYLTSNAVMVSQPTSLYLDSIASTAIITFEDSAPLLWRSTYWDGAASQTYDTRAYTKANASNAPLYWSTIDSAAGTVDQFQFLFGLLAADPRYIQNASTNAASQIVFSSHDGLTLAGVQGNSTNASAFIQYNRADQVFVNATNIKLDATVADLITTIGNIIPNANNADDLGSTSKRFTNAGFYSWQGFNLGSAPSAPAASSATAYFRIVGGGKMSLCVLFPSGAEQVLATEP